MNPMTTSLRIIGFHNCDGCTQKVTTALRRFIGLRLVEFDRETGIVTVSTGEHPEVIRYALERQIKKPVVIVSANQNPNSLVPAQRTVDLQGLGESVLNMCQVLDSVEITHSNVYRVSFNHRENPPVVRPEPRANILTYGGVHVEAVDVDHAPRRAILRAPPWPVAEPSAPLISSEEEEVYGYPPEFYGYSASHDRPNGCCTIM